jgi:hypothetical protein
MDGKVLDYYSGTFESVYVCLNPFIRPSHIDPARFCPERYPSQSELLALCEPVSWAEVMKITGLRSIAEIDRALKTQILAVRAEFMHRANAKTLEMLYDRGIIMPPGEGDHSPFLLAPVMSVFKELGHDWAWVGDEFGTERKLHWVEDLATKDPTPFMGHANVFSADKSLLWAVHWDSHFTFLCGSATDLERAKVAERIEGFFCTSETDVYWSVVEA